MRSTNERKAKTAALSGFEDLRPLLALSQNPLHTTGVTLASIKKHRTSKKRGRSGTVKAQTLVELLTALVNRTLTGHAALDVILAFEATQPEAYHPTLLAFCDGNLKIGLTIKEMNKHFDPPLCPLFEPALAKDFAKEQKHFQKSLAAGSSYWLSRKMNGVRLLAVADPEAKAPVFKARSRLGHTYTAVPELDTALQNHVDPQYILDGELCVMNQDGQEDFLGAVSLFKRKSKTTTRFVFHMFDCLTWPEFTGQVQSPPLVERLRRLETVTLRVCQADPRFQVLPMTRLDRNNCDQQLAAAQQEADAKGWEGVMARRDAPYAPGRSSDLLKIKKFMDAEFTVVGAQNTTKNTLVNGRMEPTCMLGSVLIKYQGCDVWVGSGFSDAQRLEWQVDASGKSPLEGQVITVKYFLPSTNKKGTVSLQFPIFVVNHGAARTT